MPIDTAREPMGLLGRVGYGIVMDKFFEVCGLDGRLRLDLDGPGGPECRTLDQPFAVIGRTSGADLTLSDRRVSRRHAYLQAIAGEVFCVDIGSRAGVFWGRRRGRSGWVDREQGVVISPFRIRRGKDDGVGGGPEGSGRTDDPLARQSADGAPTGGVVLEFSHEAVEQSSWTMNRQLTLVGRSHQCPVRLTAPGVSRFHCSLLRTPTGVWAVDLQGRGGIVVNGASVRCRRIDDGDQLQIGSVLIRFRCETPRVGITSTVGIVPEILGWGVASGRPEMLPMPSIDMDRPRPPDDLAGASTGRAPGRGVARRVGGPFAEHGEFKDSTLGPFADEFGLMQEQMRQQGQMFDQFQQVMRVIAQRFGDKQRDQMQVVREEILRIRQLSGELQSLHSRLSTAPAHSPPDWSPPPGQAESPAVIPSTESGSTDPGPAPSQRAEGRPPLPLGGPIEAGAAATSPEELHMSIRRRMEVLEREQRSRWQRIVDLMRGPQTGPSGA